MGKELLTHFKVIVTEEFMQVHHMSVQEFVALEKERHILDFIDEQYESLKEFSLSDVIATIDTYLMRS